MATRTELNSNRIENSVRFLVDVNPNFTDKVKPGDARFWRFNMTFVTSLLIAQGLLNIIRLGHAWTAAHRKVQHLKANGRKTSYRVKRNITGVQVVGLDFDTEDERSALATLAGDAFISQHAAILHTSASHTPDKQRARVIFVLSEALPVDEAEIVISWLLAKYPHADKSAKDASRVFYGAKNCEYRLLDNVLDVATLRSEIIRPYQAHLATEQEERDRLREERQTAQSEDTNANAGIIASYVAGTLSATLTEVKNASPGTGERHARIRDAAVRLASVSLATWLTEDARRVLAGWEDALLDAARVSSYVADYGEEDTLRIIETGINKATPADEPVLRSLGDFFQPGDFVTVTHDKREMARGTIERMRQADNFGHWEALVSGIWWPRNWLRQESDNSVPDVATERQETPKQPPPKELPETAVDTLEGNVSSHEPQTELDNNSARIYRFMPPPPRNFEEDWNEQPPEEELAQNFFSATLDGRRRNIYAGLVRGKALDVEVPESEYLTTNSLPYDRLPRYAELNANTGTGKTTYARGIPGQVLIVASSTPALEQILEHEPTAHAYYHERKDATADSRLIVTTYESFKNVLRKIDASRFWLVVDESHNFGASSHKAFRGRALEEVMDTLNGAWRGVLLMTGTPVPLCHPYLAKFEQVSVSSFVRSQKAQRVIWKDEEGKGNRTDALLELCDRNQKHFIYLNNKKDTLDKVVAGLVARGFAREEIAIMNSDVKHEETGRAIIETEQIPEGARVLISTHIAVESLNLQTTFDAVHIVSDLHPYLAQQLVNRLRTDAAGIVYWYNAGTGRGYSVDVHSYQAHVLRDARSLSHELNAHASVNPNEDSMEAILARRSMRTWAAAAGGLVRVDEELETGQKRYDISYLGVDNAVFEATAEYTRRNPQAFRNALTPYGWTWNEDRLLVVKSVPKYIATAQNALATQLREEREEAHLARVADILEHGDAWTRDAARTSEDTKIMRTAQQIVKVSEALKPAEGLSQDAFLLACNLVATANDSTRKLNRTVRQIRVQHLLNDSDSFTQQLRDAFKAGDRMTSEEVQQRVLKVYNAHPVMELEARAVLKYPFSEEPESRLTPRRAVEALRDLWTVKRTSSRTEDSATPIHVYEVLGTHELAETVATLARIDNKQSKVATNSSTRSLLEAVDTLPADIPFTPSEVEAYQARQ